MYVYITCRTVQLNIVLVGYIDDIFIGKKKHNMKIPVIPSTNDRAFGFQMLNCQDVSAFEWNIPAFWMEHPKEIPEFLGKPRVAACLWAMMAMLIQPVS